MTKISIGSIFLFCCFLTFLNTGVTGSILIQNNNQEIENCNKLLDLRQVRQMGGDGEEDLNKIFKSVSDICATKNGDLYVCDPVIHHIKVFDSNWEYLRTIGRKGKGPGDFLGPASLSLFPGGFLAVHEFNGMRIQIFDQKGKGLEIIKLDSLVNWMGVNAKAEFILYNPYRTYKSRKILFVKNKKGEVLREIGNYHDRSEDYFGSEKFHVAMDGCDNIYVASAHAPVIRKFSPDGKLLKCITFEVPFEIPDVRLELTPDGKDVIIHNTGEDTREFRNGQYYRKKGKQWLSLFSALAIDSKQRIFIVSPYRVLSEEESKKTEVRTEGGANGMMKIIRPNINVDEYPKYNRILVFNKEGKVIAGSSVKLPYNHLLVRGNHLFAVDEVLGPSILEFEFDLKKK